MGAPDDTCLSGIRLERAASMREALDELAAERRPVGLGAVLSDLDRRAEPFAVPGPAAVEGFRWDRRDRRSRSWYPQGITTSADAGDGDDLAGRHVLVTSWYASRRWRSLGSRVSIVDYTDPGRPRYRHVLLVEPARGAAGTVELRPVHAHAGGILWYGGHLYVAATGDGVRVFEMDHLTAVPMHGYAYVLPQSFVYTAWSDDGVERLRYSFLSLDRTTEPHDLVAGEYGRDGGSTRLTRYALDHATGLLRTRADGHAWPRDLWSTPVQRMQGATIVHGSHVVTSSQGRRGHGDLWVGRPGRLRRHTGVLPVGPEDITYWPSRQQLWSLTEWPNRRWVYAMDARRWVPDLPGRPTAT